MTTSRRQPERRPLDFYPTPLPLCFAVCEWLDKEGFGPKAGDRILEPSSGSGNFVQAAARQWPESFIQAIDVNPAAREHALFSGADRFLHVDFLQTVSELQQYQLILGNPPYNQAEAHVRHALTQLRVGGSLAFILRLNFLGSNKRLEFWKEHRPMAVVPIVPRPDFTGDGGDSTEYALFVWMKAPAYSRCYLEPPLEWEKEKRCRTKEASRVIEIPMTQPQALAIC